MLVVIKSGSDRGRRLWPVAGEYIKRQDDFRALGLNADVVRVPLLPGASRVFKPLDVWCVLGRPDFTLSHRLMLFSGYLVRYALRR